jgi:hypothetical protein
MKSAAYLSLLLIAARKPVPFPHILSLVTAAVRSAPQSVSPDAAAVRRILGADFADPKRTADQDAEWMRFDSIDGACSVEIGPIVERRVLKLMATCEFASRPAAIDFLHEMVAATKSDWQPPVFYSKDGEIAHIGVIIKQLPVGAEAYLQRGAGDRWRAAVVLAAGGRAVTPLSRRSSPPAPRSRRTSF